MSIALERSNGIERTGFVCGISCIPIYESPESGGGAAVRKQDERSFPSPPLTQRPAEVGKMKAGPVAPVPVEREEESTSCSSSIGRNSDCSGRSAGSDGDDTGEAEVQSTYKGPLDTMDALEESLPIRRGISRFYCGKSKSFTSLADANPSSSAKDLAKPDNSYNRKRKNLLAFSINWDMHQNNPLRSSSSNLSKRPANSNRSTLSPTGGTSSSGSNSTEEDHDLPSRLLPPRHPNGKVSSSPRCSSSLQKCLFPMRSFSMTDLQGVTASTSSISPRDKQKGLH